MRLAVSLIAMSSLAACTAAGAPETTPQQPQRQQPPATAMCGRDAGVVLGVVSDARSHAPLPGVTVVLTSPAMASPQTTITDEAGAYRLRLPEGTYLATLSYLEYTIENVDVPVHAGCATPVFQIIDTESPDLGATIRIAYRPWGPASRRLAPCKCT